MNGNGSAAVAAHRWLRTVDHGVLVANRALMILALAAMALIVFANVALRYLTDASIVWSEEVARHLMIWLTFLGIGPVLRLGGHIAIDSLQAALPERPALLLRAVVLGLLAAFCLVVIWYGIDLVRRTWSQTTPVTGIPFSVVSAAVPTGFTLALWHLLAVARGYVRDNTFEMSPDLAREEAGSV